VLKKVLGARSESKVIYLIPHEIKGGGGAIMRDVCVFLPPSIGKSTKGLCP
jgi:hypothetical protein